MQSNVLILDFGSQYSQVIARRVRELNIYCEIHPFDKKNIDYNQYKAIILSGSPHSVREDNFPKIDLTEIRGKKPLLGICYGAQLMTTLYGGTVSASKTREYGKATLQIAQDDPFLENLQHLNQVWMSHGDTITELPKNTNRLAGTNNIENAAFKFEGEDTYGVQFHPEVSHTEGGKQLLENFLVNIAGLKQDWTPNSFVESTISELQRTLGQDQVVLGLSGGVDSSVAALLLKKAIGERLHCIFINNGLLRKGEYTDVLDQYKTLGLNIKGVDASKQFLNNLKNVTDPEEKRKQIGKTFIDVFEEQAQSIPNVKWLGQGTIYPDVIESVSSGGPSVTIKSHHNVGGLPEKMNLKVIEPLRLLFKDEVRKIGKALNMPQEILGRHPFPGPGLAIRIIGEISEARVKILQEADAIFINNLKEESLYDEVWQAGVMLLPVQSVGVMGDERSYEQVVALRAVTSKDGMTADWVDFPHNFLKKVSNDIINKVKGINRVVYDISSKPPATIEWE